MQHLIDAFTETLRDAGSRGTPLAIRGGGRSGFPMPKSMMSLPAARAAAFIALTSVNT